MDIIRLKEYYELKLPEPLPFFNHQWNKYIEILGPVKTVELHEYMQGKKHACSAPFYYLMRELSYKLYSEKKRPYHAWDFFDIPINTAEGHFTKYKELYPHR